MWPINDFQTEWEQSAVGLCQGGILSSILTNFYSATSDCSLESPHAEFADDNYKWESHGNDLVAANRLQNRLDLFGEWCSVNVTGISSTKIKMLFFRPQSAPRPFNKIDINLNGNIIEDLDEEEFLLLL